MEYFVVKEDANGADPTPAYCQGIRDQYGLTMPVLMDPDNLLGQSLGYGGPKFNQWNVVLGPGVTIAFKKPGETSSVPGAIENLLGL